MQPQIKQNNNDAAQHNTQQKNEAAADLLLVTLAGHLHPIWGMPYQSAPASKAVGTADQGTNSTHCALCAWLLVRHTVRPAAAPL
jgi:hypothetical protein